MNNQKKILVVDDNASVLTLVNGILKDYYKVYSANSGDAALKFIEKQIPDLILLDVEMPDKNGYEIIEILKSNTRVKDIPVIFLTGNTTDQSEVRALGLGAVDYIQKPIIDTILRARVKMHLARGVYEKRLQSMVNAQSLQIKSMQGIALNLLAYAKDSSDSVADESNFVKYVCALMDAIPQDAPQSYLITPVFYKNMKQAAKLYNASKKTTSYNVGTKTEGFTTDEYELLKIGTTNNELIIKNAIDSLDEEQASILDLMLEILISNHEKWDGSGYPKGLKREEIPLSGRLVAIADVYESLTAEYSYNDEFSHEDAMNIIKQGAKQHFDPFLTDVFMSIKENIKSI